MGNCNRCQATIIWPTPFTKGNKPMNPDSTPHFCKTAQASTSQPSLFEIVKWDRMLDEEITEDMKELLIGLKTMRSLAYRDAKDVHPEMQENSNTFGQIVNAGISHLINLAKVKALRVKK